MAFLSTIDLRNIFGRTGLPIFLDTLNEMGTMGAFVGIVNALRFATPEGKIDVATKLFDPRKTYYFLLTTEVW